MTPRLQRRSWADAGESFYLDAGWGTWGFKASAVCGETMAEMAATGRTELIAPFRLSRFGTRTSCREGHGVRLALGI